MDFKTYQANAEEAARCVERGAHEDALRLLKGLAESDLPDLDRVVMAANVAKVYEKLGRIDEAAEWYARAVALEEPHGRVWARMTLADFMATHGRSEDALSLYKALLARKDLTLAERERIDHNLAALE